MKSLTEGYSVFMALQDYLPVILSSIGLYLLARMVARIDANSGRMAALGWILVTLGGASKATWKLIMAASNNTTNITFLDDSLFFFMGPGFLFLGFGLWYAWRRSQERKLPTLGNIWVVPVLITAAFVGTALFLGLSRPQSRTWFFIMLALTTICNFVVGGLIIRQGWRLGMKLVVILFAFNLAAILMLTGMARVDPQTIPLEWAAQITNTLSNAAFAYGAFRLSQTVIARRSAPAGLQAA